MCLIIILSQAVGKNLEMSVLAARGTVFFCFEKGRSGGAVVEGLVLEKL